MASTAANPASEDPALPAVQEAKKKPPIPPVTPRLRIVLYVVLILFGVLAANGLYLTSITLLQYVTEQVYETHFYQLMFLIHLGLGLLLILPTVGFGLLHMWRARNRRNRRAVKIGYALLTIVAGDLGQRLASDARWITGDRQSDDSERCLLDAPANTAGGDLAVLAASFGWSKNQVARRPTCRPCDWMHRGSDGWIPGIGPADQRRRGSDRRGQVLSTIAGADCDRKVCRRRDVDE